MILAIPLPVRLGLLAGLGAILGAAVNVAVCRFSWGAAAWNPWLARHCRDACTSWRDRLPIAGWWLLRRRRDEFGRGFWLRPLVVELAMASLASGWYWWSVEQRGLVPPGLAPGGAAAGALAAVLHVQYLGHLVLFSLMLAATLIDVDEQIIPDAVTVPGTLAGLAAAVLYPWFLLPGPALAAPALPLPGAADIEAVVASSPNPWPAALEGRPQTQGLAIALGCFALWCVGLLPRSWRARRGWRRAAALLWARIARERASRYVAALAVAGSAAIVAVWAAGGPRWIALVSALLGTAVGGGIVWVTRFVGSWVLRREAMGFGDVTLLAMIGAFVGWQAVLLVFFLAPFAGLVIGVAQWLVRRDHVIPYGPFLCLAALVVLWRWAEIWDWALALFGFGWLVPAVVGLCFVMLAVLLIALQAVKRLVAAARA